MSVLVLGLTILALGRASVARAEEAPSASDASNDGRGLRPVSPVGLFARFKTYSPGAFLSDAAGPRASARRIGCLDVRADGASDAQAAGGSITVAFRFGNRCARAVDVEIERVLVTEFDASGKSWTMAPHDPFAGIRTRTLDGRASGREIVEYRAQSGAPSNPARVCVDMTDIAGDGATRETPVCLEHPAFRVDPQDVVGYRDDRVFGETWHARPFYFFSELSISERTIGLGDLVFSGDAGAGRSFKLSGKSLNRVDGFGVSGSFDLRVLGPLYAGLSFRVHGAHLGARPEFETETALVKTGSTVEEIGGGALLGLLTRPAGNLRFRADVAFGESLVLVDARVLGCGSTCADSVHAGRTWLEPRLVMDAWLTPWWTVSAWSALDVLHVPDVSVGLALAFHLRSFDGFP